MKSIKITNLKKIFISYKSALEDKQIVEQYSEGIKHTFDPAKYHLLITEWLPFRRTPKTILDIGCGEGTTTDFLAHEFADAKQIIGVDISEEMVQAARKQYKEKNVDFRIGSMEELPVDDLKVDFVFSRLAIHYSRNLTKTFSEIARVTKPGGLFFLKDAHPFFATFLKKSLDYSKKEDVVFHTQCDDDIEVVHPTFTIEEYINTAVATGWEIVSLHEPYGRGGMMGRSGAYRVPSSICMVLRKK